VDKYLKDYLPYVYAKFPFIAQKDIDRIITFGLKLFIKATMSNVWVIFTSGMFFISSAKMYKLYYNFDRYMYVYKNALRKKLRFLLTLRKYPYDGYYYFYMNKKQYEAFLEENKSAILSNKRNKLNKKPYVYRNITMFKYQDELWAKSFPCKNVFRYPIEDSTIYENKNSVYCKELKTSKVEQILSLKKSMRSWNLIRYSIYDYKIKNYKIDERGKWKHKQTSLIKD
jgi:hypothetical protein